MKNATPSVDAYICLKNIQCQISFRSDLKRRSLRLFWWGRPNKKKNNNNEKSMRSVP